MPAPLGPMRAVTLPRSTQKDDIRQGRQTAEMFAEARYPEERLAPDVFHNHISHQDAGVNILQFSNISFRPPDGDGPDGF